MAGIYLHIPFCKSRCIYCDFYSTTQNEWIERYIDALCLELELRKDYLQGEPIETIYFGGGTPSQLCSDSFKKVFDTIHRVYGMDKCTEITLEANPDDLRINYLHELSKLPFNRISMGIQTFDDRMLKVLHRRHTAQQAIRAVEDCRQAGFNNISIDLMYGLPGESKESWKRDLQQAISLGVEHISAYHLIYEEGTELYKMLQKHRVEEVSEDNSVEFFAKMSKLLGEAGFQHYEISNFCQPGKYAKHNSSYWIGKKYLGCGPSAHSFDGTNRQWNISSLHNYIIGIEKREPQIEIEKLDIYTRYNDYVITSLRTMWGLSLPRLKAEFGNTLYDYCLSNAKAYLLNGKLEQRNDCLILGKSGVFVSDGIMSDLLWV
ncbi:MAG: radical SAM family heme chaperone HemW [Bacteroides sp.]